MPGQTGIRGLYSGKVWRPGFKSLRVGAYGLIGRSARPTPGPSRNLRGLAMSIENLPGEEWRPVVGYESLYEVSSMGRVRSLPRKHWSSLTSTFITNPGCIMRLQVNKRRVRYMFLVLTKDGVKKNHYVHRLVAMAFVPGSGGQALEINHISGIKSDNRATNLEWVSHKENVRHAISNDLVPKCIGAVHRGSIPVEAVHRDGTPAGVFANMREASEALGVPLFQTRYPYGAIRVPGKGVPYYVRRAYPSQTPKGTT